MAPANDLARRIVPAGLLLLAVCAFSLCAPCSAQTTESPAEIIREFAKSLITTRDPVIAVKQLGADERKVRKAAKKVLMDLGAAAMPALKDGLKSNDPEVRLTCNDILANVSRKDIDSPWFKNRTKVNRALKTLGASPDPKAWDPLLKILKNADEVQRLLAARAIVRMGPDQYEALNQALRSKAVPADRVVLVLQEALSAKGAEAAISTHAGLKALLPDAKKALAAQAKWKPSWTTGKIDKHIYGLHTHKYTSDPIAPMDKPVLGVAYGFWGGKGEGDRSGKAEFTVQVNGVEVGKIPTTYSGYKSPGPSVKLFDLSTVAAKGTFEIAIVAGSGGDSVIGEVKIFDMMKNDPGVVKARDKFYGLGKDEPVDLNKK